MVFSLLERDTVTIKRLGTTQDAAGGKVESYTTANRGSLPTSWKCRIQEMAADEAIRYGLSGTERSWKFLGTSNPQIDERDQITFTDSESVAHTVEVVGAQRNPDNQGILFQVNGEEVSNET